MGVEWSRLTSFGSMKHDQHKASNQIYRHSEPIDNGGYIAFLLDHYPFPYVTYGGEVETYVGKGVGLISNTM